MFSMDDFTSMGPKETAEIISNFMTTDPINPFEEEGLVYNLAGVMAARLREDFDLTKISKRDVALFLVANAWNPTAVPNSILNRVVKYVKGYFALQVKYLCPASSGAELF